MKLVLLGIKFDGDPQQLGFFLAHVLTYMQVYGKSLPNNAKIRVITLALEGTAAWWMVTLYNCNAPELWNFNHFMTALRHCFKDHLADQKAKDQIKTIKLNTERSFEIGLVA